MHPNPVFHEHDLQKNLRFARDRAFGVVTVSAADGPIAAHLPFLVDETGSRLEAHVVRSNPLWRALETPQRALMIVSGPDGYISPDWYGAEGLVPTRNYVAVHLRGTLRRRDPNDIHEFVERLSDAMEARLLPKTPWKVSKLDDEALARLFRMIVPIEMEIDEVRGTWKLNQNRTLEQAHAAADHLEAAGLGQETSALAALMREANGS